MSQATAKGCRTQHVALPCNDNHYVATCLLYTAQQFAAHQTILDNEARWNLQWHSEPALYWNS